MSDLETAPRLEQLLDEPGPALAASLYGPGWRSSVPVDGGTARARGFPPERRLAEVLEPVLSGSVAHDARSPRAGRSLGWWSRDPVSGVWEESSPESLADVVADVLDPVVEEARARLSSLREEVREIPRRKRDGSPLIEHLEGAALSAEVLRSSLALVDHGPRWARVLSSLRSRLRLSEDDLREIVREWLALTAEAEGWAPGDRLEPEVLRSLYVETYDGALPALTFARAVPLVLEQHKSGGSRFYVFDPDAVEVR